LILWNYLMCLRDFVSTFACLTVVCSTNLQADEEEYEDIDKLNVMIVTAQKRQESLQEIPLSITAISAEELDRFSLSNSDQIAQLVPNLNVSRSFSGTLNYFIRGIGMDDFNLSSVPAIGLYLDDVAIHNPLLANFALYDLERVEILRGPQNALFGKNTTGGAINFISNVSRQDDELNGLAKLTLGNYNARYFDAASNVIIDDDTHLRFSLFNHQRQGLTNSSLANNDTEYNNLSRWGLRSQIVHQINQQLELQASLYGGKQNQIAEVKTLLLPGEDSTIIDINDADLSQNDSALINPPNNVTSLGGYLKFKWHLENFDLTSITASETTESKRTDDWGSQSLPSSVDNVINYHATDTHYYSQEFQLVSNQSSQLDWLIGALVDIETGDILQTAFIDPGGPGRPDDAINDAGIGPLFDRGAWLELNTKSYSVYGQIAYDLNQMTTLTTGLRWTRQNLQPLVNSAGMMMDLPDTPFPLGSFGWYSLGNPGFDVLRDHAGFSVINNFVDANGGFPASAKINENFSQWGGKVAIDYQYNPDVLLYAYLARGFKMGSVNSNPTTASFVSLLDKVVKPETLTTLELGAKSQWLSDQLRLNGALFHNQWQDYQFFQVFNPGNPASLFATLINLPEARSYGAELELKWLASESLEFNLGLGWLNTEVINATLSTDGIPSELQDDFQRQVVNGNSLTNAPEWVYNISVMKSFYFAQSELDLLLHYDYTDEHIHMLAGDNSEIWQQNFSEASVGLLNLNAALHFGSLRQFKLALWAKNLLDEQYCRERSTIPGANTELTRLCVQGESKTVGLTFSYQFD
jgi:iron complex outermembrane recepter protein